MSSISGRLRDKLNEYASVYYEAKQQDDQEKSDEAFQEMGFDTMGWDTLGSGRGRIVIDLDIAGYPNLVVKLATPDAQYDGRRQNRQEIDIWRSASAEEREFLVPVLESGPDGYWLIMKQGDNKSGSPPYDWKSEAEYVLSDIIWEEDIREENIVKLNGEYRICDYGTPPQ